MEDGGGRREEGGGSIALASDTSRAESQPSHPQTCIDLLDKRSGDLDQWEIDFLISIKWAEKLTKPQADKLAAIQGRLDEAAGKKPGNPLPIKVAVLVGTPAWEAWRKAGKVINSPISVRDDTGRVLGTGWYFPTEFPPTSEAAA